MGKEIRKLVEDLYTQNKELNSQQKATVRGLSIEERKQLAIQDLKRFVEEYGRIPTQREAREYSSHINYVVTHGKIRFSELLKMAGYEPRRHRREDIRGLTLEEILSLAIRDLKRFVEENGRLPTYKEACNYSIYISYVIKNHRIKYSELLEMVYNNDLEYKIYRILEFLEKTKFGKKFKQIKRIFVNEYGKLTISERQLFSMLRELRQKGYVIYDRKRWLLTKRGRELLKEIEQKF